ncbi:hypothetical protein LAZ67_23001178 [Cordylochernes scorpioides]|uniref:Uncharacterized protein n=1 Tax=Cordylochernes scorpioides TaxID=51811 RepID=A0ABY6LUH7_9ARAC|nr:hypothetical protein LAZ67_23001178 [Cordylochernes scorpioides]
MRANGLKKKLFWEKIEVRRKSRRPPMSWLEGVKEATGRSLYKLPVMVINRADWARPQVADRGTTFRYEGQLQNKQNDSDE